MNQRATQTSFFAFLLAFALLAAPATQAQDLVINEFMANPNGDVNNDLNNDGTANTGDEFVEIFNAGDAAVDLSGYQLDDVADGGTDPYTFPDGTTLGAGEYAVIINDANGQTFGAFTDSGVPSLNNSGDDIRLLDADGGVVTSYTYSGSQAYDGVSAARNPNGTGSFERQDSFGAMTNDTVGADNGSMMSEFATVTFDDQVSPTGQTVMIASVTLPEDGYVAIHDSTLLDDPPQVLGSVVGVSEYLEAGTYAALEVTLFNVPGGVENGNYPADQMALDGSLQLIAMPHQETSGNMEYNFVTSGGEADGAYLNSEGGPVVDPAFVTVPGEQPMTPNAWLNEIHYDNDGGDEGEFVEVVLEDAATYDLSSFAVEFYNGSDGGAYETVTLDTFDEGESQGDYTVYSAAVPGIQNGAPDGLAVCYNGAPVVSGSQQQFLSYEGTLTAADGCAAGASSTDIGVSETNSTPAGQSLQLMGEGEGMSTTYDSYAWAGPTPETPGTFNDNQDIDQTIPVEFDGTPTARVNGNAVTLSWATLTEKNNDGFYVQHRRRGEGASVWATSDKRVPGAVNSTTRQRYNYTVTDLEPGAYEFRVQQVDTDDGKSFSTAVRATVRAEGFALEAPTQNPFHAQTELLYSAPPQADVQAALYNSLGQRVRELRATGGRITLDAGSLASGVYFVRITDADGRSDTQSVTLVR